MAVGFIRSGLTRFIDQLAVLGDLRVPTSPFEQQREFTFRIAAVERLKAAQRSSLAELDALFASVQHRTFRGEL